MWNPVVWVGLIAAKFVSDYAWAWEESEIVGMTGTIVFANYLFLSMLGVWVVRDRALRGYRSVYDFDTSIFVLGPFAAAVYFVASRGWRDTAVVAGLLVTFFLSPLAADALAEWVWNLRTQ
jgi:hypothetical protein